MMEPYEIASTKAAEYEARRAMLLDRLREREITAAVVTDPRDLMYLIGYSGTTPLGPNPFAGGCSSALVVTSEGAALVVGLPDPWMIELDAGRIEVRPFDTFGDLTPLRPRRRFGQAVANALTALGAGAGTTVGYEAGSLPVLALRQIETAHPGARLVDIDTEVALTRMRKSPSELAALRRSIAVCDLAQAAAAAKAVPGVTQQELFATIRDTVETATGTATPILIEASYGGNFGEDGKDRALREGDLLVVDIAPRVAGYWGDSCNTHVLGEPTDEQRRMLTVIREALAMGTEAARPGVEAEAVDAIMRDHVAGHFPAYPGSGGHGIGVDFHEPPRLMPGERTTLEPGMVIALEPGVYLEHACARVEHLVEVGRQGCEVISRHLLG
jgi:Xaa-Pro aminopeptidase